MDNLRALINFSILNTNWRNGKNYLDSLIPFVEELFARKKYEEVNLNRICQDFEKEFFFRIPHHPMKVVLKKLVRLQKIEYCGKEVWKNKITEEALLQIKKEHVSKYQKILDSFCAFVKNEFSEEINEEDANKALIAFLERQDFNLLFYAERNAYLLPKVEFPRKLTRKLAIFLQHEEENDSEIFKYIVEISAGHMLASTIANKAKQPYDEKVKKVRIYCDTTHILRLLGLDGNIQQNMTEDLFEIFKNAKCQLVLFKHTYDEVLHNITNAKRWHVDSRRDMSKASRTLMYFVANNFTELEIENILNSIDPMLNSQGILVEDYRYAENENSYNIDVKKLNEIIVDEYRKTNEYFDETHSTQLLENDVNSINMVYRKLHGKYPKRFKDMRIVFMCANSSLAKACRAYHYKIENPEEGDFIPICVTDIFLGTYIWLQSPSQIDELAKRKLIAETSALLRPTDTMIRKYLVAVEECYKRQNISEEDYLLLKARSVITELLAENVENVESITERTPAEILERLKSQSKEEGLRKFYEEREKHQRTQQDLDKEQRNRKELKNKKRKRILKVVASSCDYLIGGLIFFCILFSVLKVNIYLGILAAFITAGSFWGFARGQLFYGRFRDKIALSIANKIFEKLWGDL